MKICTFFLLQCIALCIALDPQFDIPDDWVDPTDMLTFDYGTKTNRGSGNSDKKETVSVEEERKDAPKAESAEKLEDVSTDKTSDDSTEQIVPNDDTFEHGSCKQPFLRRFVTVLQRQIGAVGSPPGVENFEVTVHLDSRSWLTLQEFTEECQSAAEVTRILEDMVTHVHVQLDDESVWKKKFEDFILIPFEECMKLGVSALIVVSILCMEFWSRVSWSSQIKRLMILVFCISIAMTYFHELKLAEAEYKSKATDIPPECIGKKGERLSYWGSFKSMLQDTFSVGNDPCAEYHANYLISPHLKVTPTKVLAVTLTRFAVEPMEHIGTAFSKAFKNIFAGLPITLWIPAFLFVILVILGFMLVVAVCFGYNFSVNLPFWAGLQMGPQQPIHHNPEMDRVLEDNRRHIDQLNESIRELRERPQQPALPAPTASPRKARGILEYFGIGGSSPPEDTPPPPYPAQQTHGSGLPYPEYEHPDFAGGEPASNSGLRRRNTIPRTAQHMGYESGDHQFPHPARNFKVRSSSTSQVPQQGRMQSNQNPIGFEQLLEETGNEDPDQVMNPPNSTLSQGTQDRKIHCQDTGSGEGGQKSNIPHHASSGDAPVQNRPTDSEPTRPTTVSRPVQECLIRSSGDAGSTLPKVPQKPSPTTTQAVKAIPDSIIKKQLQEDQACGTDTLPEDCVLTECGEATAATDFDGWEDVSVEETEPHIDTQLSTMEFTAVIENEAREGFK